MPSASFDPGKASGQGPLANFLLDIHAYANNGQTNIVTGSDLSITGT